MFFCDWVWLHNNFFVFFGAIFSCLYVFLLNLKSSLTQTEKAILGPDCHYNLYFLAGTLFGKRLSCYLVTTITSLINWDSQIFFVANTILNEKDTAFQISVCCKIEEDKTNDATLHQTVSKKKHIFCNFSSCLRAKVAACLQTAIWLSLLIASLPWIHIPLRLN